MVQNNGGRPTGQHGMDGLVQLDKLRTAIRHAVR